jgi:hypothetical protein
MFISINIPETMVVPDKKSNIIAVPSSHMKRLPYFSEATAPAEERIKFHTCKPVLTAAWSEAREIPTEFKIGAR